MKRLRDREEYTGRVIQMETHRDGDKSEVEKVRLITDRHREIASRERRGKSWGEQ